MGVWIRISSTFVIVFDYSINYLNTFFHLQSDISYFCLQSLLRDIFCFFNFHLSPTNLPEFKCCEFRSAFGCSCNRKQINRSTDQPSASHIFKQIQNQSLWPKVICFPLKKIHSKCSSNIRAVNGANKHRKCTIQVCAFCIIFLHLGIKILQKHAKNREILTRFRLRQHPKTCWNFNTYKESHACLFIFSFV